MAGSGDSERVGVVLMQLGGPDSLEAVEPFLVNLFSDPDIIDFPFSRLARPVLARLIAARRARKVREHYARIGGKSPLGELTGRQAKALEMELRQKLSASVFVAMRYWHPLTEEAVEKIEAGDFSQVVLLPLYPQYSRTTTGSSVNEWKRVYARFGRVGRAQRLIESFFDWPDYIRAVVEKINKGLAKFEVEAREKVVLAFSAHGVPEKVIDDGDPYREQIEATARLVMERGGYRNPRVVCYQSRVGPGRWLQPSLEQTLGGLGRESGGREVLVVPISFVSDHVETLDEIDIEARAVAASVGIKQFELMPALNDSPAFIHALAGLVERALREGPGPHARSASKPEGDSVVSPP